MGEYPYRLIREKRKTVSLSVDESGALLVKAPFTAPAGFIDGFVREKAPKLLDAWAAREDERKLKRDFLSRPPEKLPLSGKEYPVTLRKDNIHLMYSDGMFFCPERPLCDLIPSLEELYKKIAKATLIPEFYAVARMMGASPAAVRINSARGRWGSCSSKDSINFSWRLAAADERTRRYVMIHELAHLTYLDHSRQFWELVGKYEPDYRLYRDRLKTVGKLLEKYGLD